MIYGVYSKLVAFAICFLLPQFTFAGEVPSKSIDCNLMGLKSYMYIGLQQI